MQATVATFDAASGSGTVLLDDGVQIPFAPEAWHGTHLRHLRPGQRVIVELDGTPSVTALRIH